MECSDKFSAHFTTCQDIPNFYWNAHILFEVPQECKLECVDKYFSIHTHNTISHLSNGLPIQSDNYRYHRVQDSASFLRICIELIFCTLWY